MSDAPDYAALVRLFPVLRNCVDGCGEVTLTADEAAQIRLLGFPAEEGRWRVPPLPPELVRDNPLLEHLSIRWDARETLGQPNSTKGGREDSKSAVPHAPASTSDVQSQRTGDEAKRQVPAEEALAELRRKILRSVENAGGSILKRHLQKKFWRFRAKAFATALGDLIHGGSLRLEGNCVVILFHTH
jgi:hypothetical protein